VRARGFEEEAGSLANPAAPPYSKAATDQTHNHGWSSLKRMALQQGIPGPHYM